MNKMTKSFAYFIAFIIVIALLACSFYVQYYQGIIPCPLCLLQRFTIGVLGFIFLFGIFSSYIKYSNMIAGTLGLLVSTLGVFLSGRQVWLQHFTIANTSTNCDASLQYMLQVLPFQEVAKRLLQGNAECAQISWQFLH